ncbi:MAG: hypothetical protein N2491_14075, partial [Negativicutes bacterium]|nr:hypothetical protein [Negativicutes bacterium]
MLIDGFVIGIEKSFHPCIFQKNLCIFSRDCGMWDKQALEVIKHRKAGKPAVFLTYIHLTKYQTRYLR